MFNYDFLHEIRKYEFGVVELLIPKEKKILEIGGGNGFQARCFSDKGYQVESIDIEKSNFKQHEFFPVKIYDGLNIPFPDDSFDIVFSSNALEHVRNLKYLNKEIKRVLKSEGECIHILPSTVWRFWTIVTHYLEFFIRLNKEISRLIKPSLSLDTIKNKINIFILILRIIKSYLLVPVHGEIGNSITEIITFNRFFWWILFKRMQFSIKKIYPSDLFYTGHMIFGKKLSIKNRTKISNYFGSACNIFVLKNIKF